MTGCFLYHYCHFSVVWLIFWEGHSLQLCSGNQQPHVFEPKPLLLLQEGISVELWTGRVSFMFSLWDEESFFFFWFLTDLCLWRLVLLTRLCRWWLFLGAVQYCRTMWMNHVCFETEGKYAAQLHSGVMHGVATWALAVIPPSWKENQGVIHSC